MYVVEVIPFTKSLRKEALSYFSSKKIPRGSIVTIEVRKQNTKGIVISSKEATQEKSQLKQSRFALKKIKGVSKNKIYHSAFLKAAEDTANYHAVATGSVVGTMTPKDVLSQIDKLSTPKDPPKNNIVEKNRKFLIQSDTSERYSHYRNLIRSEFAIKKSVILVCPTIEDTNYARNVLSKGIEEHVFVLNSSLTKKQTLNIWNDILEHEKPALIICTGLFSGIPRHDIGFIVIEKESYQSYKNQKQPYIDLRKFIESYAQHLGAKLLLGDIMLRSEILWRFDQHEFDEFSPLKFRFISATEKLVIDMKKTKHNTGNVFEIMSSELKKLIKDNKDRNEQTFLFGARKGLSPTIVCKDCGTVVICNQCSAPMVLHGRDATEKGNMFKCHVCGDERGAGERCVNCNSWKLDVLGIGTETIVNEVRKNFPDQKVFLIDGEHTKTHKQASIVAKEFTETPGSILVGTEMALSYIHEPIENAAVVTIDALFGIPDFAIRERMLRTLLKVQNISNRKFYIQTRRAEDSIFDYAVRGNLADFYREEFTGRQKFKYPPFSVLIKISTAGKRYSVEKEMEKLKEFFSPYELLMYPAFKQEQKGKFVMNGLIRLKREDWINADLAEKLRALSPSYKVVVESDSLL